MSDGDHTWMDAHDQAALVASGQASPLELVEAAIARIERVNPQLNAVIHERFDKARAEAAGPLPDGPFRGVPLVVKDLSLMTAGDPYHAGTRFLAELGYVADHDTYLAERFRRAGFVIVGRTNTPEFGSTITTEPVVYGPSRNPWNPAHSTGGSSGGSAAAVASGMVAVGHANDGGGSIRIPASECGLVGLKPTRGRVSQGPDHGEGWAGSTIEHAVTRTVRDSAAVLDAICGYVPGDPYAAPPPARPFAAEVGADPGRLRIGWHAGATLGDVTVHPECVAAVEGTLALLDELGHEVMDSRPDALTEADLQRHFVTVLAVSTAAELDWWAGVIGRPVTAEGLEPANWMYAEMGRAVSGPDYLASVHWLHGYQRRMARWWAPADQLAGGQGFDILVTPVLSAPPPPLGWLTDPVEGMARVVQLLQYTAQFNVTGQPAVSLPLHWTADGLPVGVQFVGAYGREDVLIRLAAQLEQARPWAGRRPPVSA